MKVVEEKYMVIDKLNIKIESKNTKKIKYELDLDIGYWFNEEYDSRGNEIYYQTSEGYSYKKEYDNVAN